MLTSYIRQSQDHVLLFIQVYEPCCVHPHKEGGERKVQ